MVCFSIYHNWTHGYGDFLYYGRYGRSSASDTGVDQAYDLKSYRVIAAYYFSYFLILFTVSVLDR